MHEQIIIIYCICDEVVKCLDIRDDIQCRMSTAEVMAFAIMSAMIFGCDYKKTRLVGLHNRFFRKVLSHSQLVRRIHQVPEHVWYMVFGALQVSLRNKDNKTFIVDSFPVKAYENHKSFRARIFSAKKFHGYAATKKQYFFGIKVHLVVDTDGVPIEFVFTPGSASDVKTLRDFSLDYPEGAILLGDRAYTDYDFEDMLYHAQGVKLLAKRCKHHKRQHKGEDQFLISIQRNFIETVFSSIVSRMPRYVRARTEKGFCLKVFFFILAYMVNLYFPLS